MSNKNKKDQIKPHRASLKKDRAFSERASKKPLELKGHTPRRHKKSDPIKNDKE